MTLNLMMTKKEFKKSVDFEAYRKEQLKDPEMKKYYDKAGKQLEIAYQILQLLL